MLLAVPVILALTAPRRREQADPGRDAHRRGVGLRRASVLLLHASTHGHTSKIAARIAAVLEAEGLRVDVRRTPLRADEPAPRDYDAVLVGASIHAGHHQKEIVAWAKRAPRDARAPPLRVLQRLPHGR